MSDHAILATWPAKPVATEVVAHATLSLPQPERVLAGLVHLDDEIAVDQAKAEMKALDGRRKELEAQLKTSNEPPPLLHPEMARIYRTKVTGWQRRFSNPRAGSRRPRPSEAWWTLSC